MMRDRLPPLPLFRTFEAAARHLSFKQAADELCVTPAAVSQQIKALETHLGVPLFLRLTRALRLSEQGAAMLPSVQAAFGCLDEAVRRAGVVQTGGRLTVVAPPSFASHWLVPRLPAFHAAHPEIELHLASRADTVDSGGEAAVLATLDRPAGDEGCAMAIVYGAGHHAGCRVDALLAPELVPVCAPGLATAARPLHTPADLCRQVLIHSDIYGSTGRSGQPWGWPQWLQAAGVDTPVATPGRHFSDAMLAIEAALAGQGVALAARPMVAPSLAAGTLVAPFPVAIRSPYTYWLVARADVARRPAAVAFRQWVVAQAALDAISP